MNDDKPVRREFDYDRLERNKDLAQEAVQTTANRVGRIATIITGAVADVAREIGELVTDGFEMREAAKQAKADKARLDRMAADRGEIDIDDDPDFDEPVSLDKELPPAADDTAQLTRAPRREALEARDE